MLLSSLPVFLWGAVFLYKTEEKRYMIVKTFMLGALLVVPLVVYRGLWDLFPSISLVNGLMPLQNYGISFAGLGLNLLVLYASIGIIEEFLKALVVKKVDRNEVNTIKDAIEFSVMVALGFSFAENTFYFIQVYQNYSLEMLFQVFIFRSLFSTFAHVLFSAVYGYHFGLSLFAKKVYQNKQERNIPSQIIYSFYRLLSFKKNPTFKDKHRFLGLFYAASLHAMFNILLEMGITMFLIPFLFVGVVHVSYMLYNQENHVVYNPEKKRATG
jgi:RsiW-degrading membrane proteinase PrsW (M82 family)